mgnify:CR=1 FL=1
MTISHDWDERLSFDKADRMRRALRVSDIAVGEMADYLQVSRNTVTAWINGRNEPRRRDLAAFALRTGFPVAWLETGEAPHDGGAPDGGITSHLGESNSRPNHYMGQTSHHLLFIADAA